MPEDQQKADPLDTAIASINAKLEDKFKSQDDKLDAFASTIGKEINKIVAPTPPKKTWLDSDEDDATYVTKADLKNMMRETINEVKDSTVSTTKKIVEEHSNKNNRDIQALRDHPEINNKKWLEEVERDMMARVNRGRSAEDPDLFADSVAAVYARGVRQGLITPKHLVTRKHEQDNAGDDNFDMGTGGHRKDEGPSAHSIAIARRMGMSEAKFRELLDSKRKSS